MCTYRTETVPLAGSAKGGGVWTAAATATVYFDHPVHAPAGHSLNVDVWSAAGDRLAALELDPDTARSLAATILRQLAGAEQDGLLGS